MELKFEKNVLKSRAPKPKKEAKYTILVVDDEPSNLDILSLFLKEKYNVLSAKSGREALDLVNATPSSDMIQLVLVDQKMPEMTGVEFLTEIVPIIPRTIRIIMTGYADIDAVIGAINEGQVYKYLQKPIDLDQLEMVITRSLETFELERKNSVLVEELKTLNSTLEEKVRERTGQLETTNQHLKAREAELVHFNENLESLVRERTKALEENHKSLRESEKMASLGILVAGMAHEVNNPNNFIQLNIQILEKAWTDAQVYLKNYEDQIGEVLINRMPLDYAQQKIPILIQGIREGADRIAKLVLSLKNFSNSSPHDLNEQVDLNEALDAVCFLMQNITKKSTHQFIIQKASKLPPVLGNQMRLEQVLLNLIQNACEALESFNQAVQITTFVSESDVVVEVKDEGCGMDSESLNKVKDPFFTTKYDSGGTGLGLSISAGIVKEHHGTLHFESSLGQGTLATIKIPMLNESS